MKKTPAILVSLVVVALVAVITVLGVRAKNGLQLSSEQATSSAPVTEASTESYEYLTESVTATETETTQAETAGFFSQLFSKDETTAVSTTAVKTTVTGSVLNTATTLATTLSTRVATTVDKSKFNAAFTMPVAPRYIPQESNIDFDTASLASYKFDPVGNYYYTDDKNAWQKGFGYNKIYDSLAVATAMYYDTVRTTFTYEDKDWLLQIWKGQYGYYFVGEEIGLYTKRAGTAGNTYACADKEDWIQMEMCFMWDENKTGDYEPIFTRPYGDYWWCTGFVVGFESRASLKSREQFRMVAHLTFKDTEMAQAFAQAFAANGFKRVNKIDTNEVDTFVQIGPDVAFVWQNINQHTI